jgi:hypothetical protein
MPGYLLFSDLHCQLKTKTTCLAVLRAVHALALAERRTVVFLGDFFNSVYCKAAISVELLNVLVEYFSSEWTVKSYFLVGNHDMPLLTSTENGLRVFGKVNSAITVVEVPAVHEGALFIPYLHDPARIIAAVREHGGRAQIILAHAEIKGAMLNSSMRSAHGVDPDELSTLPIVSGHLHMPHALYNGRVVYCGSPYQCSLSEAEQRKRLLRYSPSWEREQDEPIAVGTRYYKIQPGANLKRRFAEISSALQPHDVVVLDQLCPADIPEDQIQQWDASVLVRRKRPRAKRLRASVESTLPTDQFRQYMQGKSPVVLAAGLEMVAPNARRERDPVALQLESVQLVHFGPFKDPVVVSFKKGVTLVTAVRQLAHLSSNGAGKSLLTCGALLWVLTGEADPRPTMQSSMSGASKKVVHHGCDFSSITLTGTRNGEPFVVSRRMSAVEAVKHRLTVSLAGEDHTHSVLKQTQLYINRTLFNLTTAPVKSPGRALRHFLLRTIVWNQHVVPRFSDASAKDTKTELGWLIDASAWQALSDKCKGTVAYLKKQASGFRRVIENGRAGVENTEHSLAYEVSREAAWVEDTKESVAQARRLLECTEKELAELDTTPRRVRATQGTQALRVELGYLRRVPAPPPTVELPSLAVLETSKGEAQAVLARLDKRYNTATAKRSAAQERRTTSARMLRKFSSRGGDWCDHCRQRVPGGHVDRMVEKLKAVHQENLAAFDAVSLKQDQLLKKVRRWRAAVHACDDRIRLFHQQANGERIKRKLARRAEIETQIVQLAPDVVAEQRHNAAVDARDTRAVVLRTEKEHLARELLRFRALSNPHQERADALRAGPSWSRRSKSSSSTARWLPTLEKTASSPC